ncbi:MAG TPA: lycopene cyclase domain-containing protein [Gemmatimonadaceae bacterium]|nr:lycopene cyclase domain-containing protein [Gemmatimonadaceae bacterium]
MPERYVWFVFACAFLAVWLILYAAYPRYRAVMGWTSWFTLPFALTEPLFVGRYWSPPTLFDLARTTHFDLESFIFCFGIGGVAAVLYNIVTGAPIAVGPKTARDVRLAPVYDLALASPAYVFAAVMLASHQPIVAGTAAMFAGAAVRMIYRPDLRAKSSVGGMLFLVYYGCFLLVLRVAVPGYIARVWNTTAITGVRVFGVPVIELLFALGVGMFWSGLYEQVAWTFARCGAALYSPHDTRGRARHRRAS